ncbi:MAG: ATP-binding protein [Kofleriaceae bacterium]
MVPWIRVDTATGPVVDTATIPTVDSSEATNRGLVRASLVCVSGPDLGTAFPISKSSVSIGRSHADITLGESEVSRRHAQLVTIGNDAFQLEDLQSSNGTLLNGMRIVKPTTVAVGDRIQIGRTVLVFTQHDELAERVARMQRLEAMATLAGGIAHDFNNALSVILFNLDVVAADLPEGDGRASLDEIRDATTSAIALAKRLLRLGRPEPLPFVAIDVQELATKTAAMARRRTNAPLELVLRIEPGVRALGSYDELHQVLLNLCLNAIDAMPKGGRLVIAARTVKIDGDEALVRQLQCAGAYVELTVTDNGCGMDDATMARAFEPFFTTKSRDQGTGLGLAMIHTSVRRHHGSVDVQSVVGHGTTFRVTLPISE